MLGAAILVPGVIGAVNQLIADITKLAENINLDFDALLNSVLDEVGALNWEEPVTALQTMISSEWLNEVLNRVLSTALGSDFQTFADEIALYIGQFGATVAAYVVVFFFWWVVGFIAGMFLTRFFIRRSIARRSLWKFLLAVLLQSLVDAAFAVVTLILCSLWAYSIIFAVVIAMLCSGLIALLQAYLLYARKKIPFKQIVNFSNIGLHMLSNLIIFALSAILTLIAVAVNNLMGLFVGLALFVVAVTVINLNAESFVSEQVNSLPEPVAEAAASIDAEVLADEIK